MIMDAIAQVPHAAADNAEDRGFVVDTTFVLFFLALDTGQRLTFGIEGLLSAVTISMFIVLPYFLPSQGEKPAFERWVLGRSAIALFAIALGGVFGMSLGVLLPDTLRFVPFTLLIAAGVVSCCIQFGNVIRFRQAK